MSLAGQIAIVTGASRGIGRGIALQLGEAGATVYITGRKPGQSLNSEVGLSGLEETANDITKRGGKGIARYVDHGNMEDVRRFFEEVEIEQEGQLDILVNNAYQGVQIIFENEGKTFYETEPEVWDVVNNVGLRNHYFCSVFAARIMAANKKGLIVNVSSLGGLKYLFNVAYGVGKTALDRLTADMAHELKPQNVCVVSIWPGAVRTELVGQMLSSDNASDSANAKLFANGETVEYSGKAVVGIAADRKKMDKTGKIHITGDLGSEYGFVDIDGLTPPNLRSLNTILRLSGYVKIASMLPAWVRMPGWMIWAATSRL